MKNDDRLCIYENVKKKLQMEYSDLTDLRLYSSLYMCAIIIELNHRFILTKTFPVHMHVLKIEEVTFRYGYERWCIYER